MGNVQVDRAFYHGVALVLAHMIRGHGSDVSAPMIANELGISFSDFERAGVDEYDLEVLRGPMEADEEHRAWLASVRAAPPAAGSAKQ